MVVHTPLRRLPQRAGQLTVRRTNLALVLRNLRQTGPRSRARIAEETGLNKATVSSLVAELVARGLVAERGMDRGGSVGRPGLAVELDGSRVYGIGIEINVDYVAVMVLNLRDAVVFERRLALDTPRLGPSRTLDALAEPLREALALADAPEGTLAGITIAIPGLIEAAPGLLSFAPNLGWRDIPIVAELAARIPQPNYPIRVQNDANVAAIGEWALGGAAGTPHLVYLTGEVGVGAGVIVDGQLLCGAEGFSGEVGHMPLQPDGEQCGCGRRGCWETMVGLAALLRQIAEEDDPVRDPSLDLEQRLTEISGRARANDARTVAALARIGTGLGVGASILVNLFNPDVLVLGGYFAVLGDYLLEPMMTELEGRTVAPGMGGCRVELSTLGFTAAARGGAHLALEAVLDDPSLVSTTRTALAGQEELV